MFEGNVYNERKETFPMLERYGKKTSTTSSLREKSKQVRGTE